MAQNYIQEGERLEITSGGAITSGALVTAGDIVGVALGAATASGQTVVVALEGVFEVTKVTGAGTNWAVGTVVYRDGTNNRVTATATNNKAVGYVWKQPATTDTTVQVKLWHLPAGPTS